MAAQGADHVSQGDLMRRIRDLERKVQRMETARRLESASIGEGGLTVKGGAIVVLDDDGEERARLSTEGLSLHQLIEILDGGEFLFYDENDVRRVRVSGRANAEANISYRSSADVSAQGDEVVVGAIFHTDGPNEGEIFGHGMLVQQADGNDLLRVWSIEGGPSVVVIRDGRGNSVLQASDDSDQHVSLHDDTGSLRATMGPVTEGGSPAGYGALVQDAVGNDLLFVSDGRAMLSAFASGAGFVEFDDDDDDQIDLYDAAGNFRATMGPVSWSGSPDGHGIYLTDGAGTDRFFASENRIWIRTTNDQQGEVTAGPVDSAGGGFRTLRIPN